MKRWLLSIMISALIFVFNPVVKAQAQFTTCPPQSSGGGFAVQEAWKTKFPFDLVYPEPNFPTADSSCPKFTFWGLDWELCSIPMVTAIVKNLFLAKLSIDFLKES